MKEISTEVEQLAGRVESSGIRVLTDRYIEWIDILNTLILF
jgi:hypothetical protein